MSLCPTRLSLFPQALISKTLALDTCSWIFKSELDASLHGPQFLGDTFETLQFKVFSYRGSFTKLVVRYSVALPYLIDPQEAMGRDVVGVINVADTQHTINSLKESHTTWYLHPPQNFLTLYKEPRGKYWYNQNMAKLVRTHLLIFSKMYCFKVLHWNMIHTPYHLPT